MNLYKIVTIRQARNIVDTWEPDIGKNNILFCSDLELRSNSGCSTIAINACKFVLSSNVGARERWWEWWGGNDGSGAGGEKV